MKYYELTYLISPDLDQEKAEKLFQEIISFLQEKEAILNIKEEKIKKIDLAYPIKNKEKAYLATVEFYLLPEKIKEVGKKIKENKNILRYLLLNKKRSSSNIPYEPKGLNENKT